MNSKHAYLIIAHSEPEIFSVLVSLLDDSRNDIYVHIDKKTDISLFKTVQTEYSKLFFLENRIDVRWGDISQVATEFLLMETARQQGPYIYYHLISGVDLPLHSQDYIHSFIEALGNDKEFISIATEYDYKNRIDVSHKTSYYRFFTRYLKNDGTIKSIFFNFLSSSIVFVQKKLGLKRTYDMELRKGGNWMSITDNLCRFLIDQKTYVMDKFKYTLCQDEIAIPSIILSSTFNEQRYCKNDPSRSDMRLIDWKKGSPYTWTMNDYDELVNSDKIFARKFSSKHIDVVYALYKHIKEQK